MKLATDCKRTAEIRNICYYKYCLCTFKLFDFMKLAFDCKRRQAIANKIT